MKNAFELGRSFAPKVDVDLWVDARGIHKGGISIGEEYYETDPWSKREDVIRELKGYLAGIKVIDPDIPAEPYCRKCLDKIKADTIRRLFTEVFNKQKKDEL